VRVLADLDANFPLWLVRVPPPSVTMSTRVVRFLGLVQDVVVLVKHVNVMASASWAVKMGVVFLRASLVSHQERRDMLLSKTGGGKPVSSRETKRGLTEYEKGGDVGVVDWWYCRVRGVVSLTINGETVGREGLV